jgi:signal peptidase I
MTSEKSAAVTETVEITKTIVYALLIALVLRVFLFQPYTIPSASMEPNLYQGDYIIVSKYSYGYSKHSIPFSPPLFSGRIFFHAPQRGDIIVFKFPRDVANKREDFIKRLVGLPGDRMQMKGGRLYINDKELPWSPPPASFKPLPSLDPKSDGEPAFHQETAPNGKTYTIQKWSDTGGGNDTGVYVVPQHCYFMMGDNRDDSLDSRFDPFMPMDLTGSANCGWDASVDQVASSDDPGVGFVPEEDLVGKAQIILLSWAPGASILEPWTWFRLRLNRAFHVLH